jgi:hypothetical protein
MMRAGKRSVASRQCSSRTQRKGRFVSDGNWAAAARSSSGWHVHRGFWPWAWCAGFDAKQHCSNRAGLVYPFPIIQGFFN